MKKGEFQEAFSILIAAYPHIDFPPNTQTLHYEMFKNHDYGIYRKALLKHIERGKFPPTIADIRECLNELLSSENNIPSLAQIEREIKSIISTKEGESWRKSDYNPISIEVMNDMGGISICRMMQQTEFERKIKTGYSQVVKHYQNCLVEVRKFTPLEHSEPTKRTGLKELNKAFTEALEIELEE